ncbi:hypothetical protein GCM10011586_07630 [Silvibacterium dinghuense]|nr:hypothetical protein GCM10011586_07630 [Silvibacterium dinghuense]
MGSQQKGVTKVRTVPPKRSLDGAPLSDPPHRPQIATKGSATRSGSPDAEQLALAGFSGGYLAVEFL